MPSCTLMTIHRMTKWYFLKYDIFRQDKQIRLWLYWQKKKTKAAHPALSRRYSVTGQSSCNRSALFNGYIVEQSSLLIDKLATWLRLSRHNLKCGEGDWQALFLWYFEYFFHPFFLVISNKWLCPIRSITVCKLFWILSKTWETIE